MRVFNLTDVGTTVLEARGLVSQHIAVAGRMINPGEYADVEDTAMVRAAIAELLQVGALSIDQPPPPYVVGRQQREASAGKLAARVDLKETAVAGEPPPGPPAEGTTAVLAPNDPTAGGDELSAPPTPEDPPPLQPPPAKKKTGK